MKITLIGAGSRSFGLGQVADILATKELKGHGVTLSLVDANGQSLSRTLKLQADFSPRSLWGV